MTIDNWDDIVKRVTGGIPAGESALEAARTAIARQLGQLAAFSDHDQHDQGDTADTTSTNSGAGTSRLMGALPVLSQSSSSLVSQGVLPSLLQTALPAAQGSGNGLGGRLLSVFTSGLGLSPLISGLLSLFGGGSKDPLPPLVKFAFPAAVNMQAGVTSGGAFGDVSYGQNGLPRMTQAAAPAAPQITVQVQAMDSKSFLDHSEDIARAVRDAMLYSHSLNDVVADL